MAPRHEGPDPEVSARRGLLGRGRVPQQEGLGALQPVAGQACGLRLNPPQSLWGGTSAPCQVRGRQQAEGEEQLLMWAVCRS